MKVFVLFQYHAKRFSLNSMEDSQERITWKNFS